MAILADVASFALKLIILVAAIGIPLALILRVARQPQADGSAPIQVRPLNRHLRERAEQIKIEITPAAHRKALQQSLRRQHKDEAKAPGGQPARPRLFVLDFEGDLRASAVTSLREEITALLQVAGSGDEIVVRLESPGGMVHSYGLAASQLARIRKRGIRLTVVVDKVAASGGYMMACVADRIIAAPFAIIGSIGVVLQMPNFHRFLKRKDIDFELLTAASTNERSPCLARIPNRRVRRRWKSWKIRTRCSRRSSASIGPSLMWTASQWRALVWLACPRPWPCGRTLDQRRLPAATHGDA